MELDGSQHYEEDIIKYDRVRTRFLESMGIQVLRFANIDVESNFEGVCITIKNHVNTSLDQPPPSADGTPFVREEGMRNLI